MITGIILIIAAAFAKIFRKIYKYSIKFIYFVLKIYQ